jgi:hypothetical protein
VLIVPLATYRNEDVSFTAQIKTGLRQLKGQWRLPLDVFRQAAASPSAGDRSFRGTQITFAVDSHADMDM